MSPWDLPAAIALQVRADEREADALRAFLHGMDAQRELDGAIARAATLRDAVGRLQEEVRFLLREARRGD